MRKIFIIVITLLLMTIGYGQIPQSGYDMPIVVNNCAEHIPLDISVTAGDANESQSPEHRYRRIYFVHGLGGDASAMERMANSFEDKSLNIKDFPARKCHATRLEYTKSTSSIVSAANTLRQEVSGRTYADRNNTNMSPESAFLIGHSQGGMVLRTMAHLDLVSDIGAIPSYGKGYDGIVTLGSPLQGAQILNNRQMIINMGDYAYRCLIAGPTSKTGTQIVNRIIENTIGRKYNVSGSAILTKLLPVVFSDYFDDITNDYQVGATRINELNNDVNYAAYRNMPKVAFYGVEPQNRIFWRTANWLVTNPNSVAPFEANDDWAFYNTILREVFLKYVQNYITLINYNKPLKFITTKSKQRQAAEWKKGIDWFGTVDPQWQTVIGAREYQVIYNCKCTTKRLFGEDLIKSYIDFAWASDCDNLGCTNTLPIPWITTNATVKENDGVVLAESAANLPGYTHDPVRVFYKEEEPQAENRGTSHMQMRNDGGVKEKLFNLLNGRYGYFFKTENR